MAELADALDLGSSAFLAWGFDSLRGHQYLFVVKGLYFADFRGCFASPSFLFFDPGHSRESGNLLYFGFKFDKKVFIIHNKDVENNENQQLSYGL